MSHNNNDAVMEWQKMIKRQGKRSKQNSPHVTRKHLALNYSASTSNNLNDFDLLNDDVEDTG